MANPYELMDKIFGITNPPTDRYPSDSYLQSQYEEDTGYTFDDDEEKSWLEKTWLRLREAGDEGGEGVSLSNKAGGRRNQDNSMRSLLGLRTPQQRRERQPVTNPLREMKSLLGIGG